MQKTCKSSRKKVCYVAVTLFGVITHTMGFLNLNLNHDSLQEYYLSFTTPIKLSSGRFIVPALRVLMGEYVTLPLFTGVISLAAIGTSVFLMAKMFSLNKQWQIVLLSGICITNISVTAIIASYIHDFMSDSISLLLAVCAAYLWSKSQKHFSRRCVICCVVSIILSLGLYQANLAVTITLICIFSLQKLLNGASAKDTIISALQAFAILLVAVIVYLLCSVIIALIFDVSLRPEGVGGFLENHDSNGRGLLTSFILGYGLVILNFVLPNQANAQAIFEPTALLIGVFNILLICSTLWVIISHIRKRKITKLETILIFVLLLALPVCMSCVMIVSGVFHELLRYAFYLFYLLVIVIFEFAPQKSNIKGKYTKPVVLIAVIGFIICNNIQIAHMAYTKKELECQATLSAMTRIVNQLEQYEEYEYRKSKTAIFGSIFTGDVGWENDVLYVVSGLEYTNQITQDEALKNYFELMLQYPINWCTDKERKMVSKTEEFQQMPTFPNDGYISEINGIIVIKLNTYTPKQTQTFRQ